MNEMPAQERLRIPKSRVRKRVPNAVSMIRPVSVFRGRRRRPARASAGRGTLFLQFPADQIFRNFPWKNICTHCTRIVYSPSPGMDFSAGQKGAGGRKLEKKGQTVLFPHEAPAVFYGEREGKNFEFARMRIDFQRTGFCADGVLSERRRRLRREKEMGSNGPVLNLLFVGDVVGKGGRAAVRELVPELRRKYNCSFCIVNAENSANGSGLNSSTIRDMGAAAEVYTSGDHVWDQKSFESEIRDLKNVLRPANMSRLQPGKGWGVFQNPAGGSVAVINLMGKVFMRDSAYCPFETAEEILKQIPCTVKSIIVDFHAEATSEKLAMAWFLNGRVTAVIGTHTHVQTADARILPEGTAVLTDVGMVGGRDSILGRDVPDVLRKFRTGMPVRLNVTEKNIRLDAAVISYELNTGKAVAIRPLSEFHHPTEEE